MVPAFGLRVICPGRIPEGNSSLYGTKIKGFAGLQEKNYEGVSRSQILPCFLGGGCYIEIVAQYRSEKKVRVRYTG